MSNDGLRPVAQCSGEKYKPKSFKGEHSFLGLSCVYCGMPEDILDLRLNETFYKVNGIELIADGYEGPYVTLKLPGQKPRGLSWSEACLLIEALHKIHGWEEHGDAPGMSI